MDDPRAPLLLDFVRHYFAAGRDAPVTLDTPLLSEGLLDSMGITLLASFVEEQFGVPFDGTELRIGRRESIRDLLDLIGPG
jgi:acyl carrier protein